MTFEQRLYQLVGRLQRTQTGHATGHRQVHPDYQRRGESFSGIGWRQGPRCPGQAFASIRQRGYLQLQVSKRIEMHHSHTLSCLCRHANKDTGVTTPHPLRLDLTFTSRAMHNMLPTSNACRSRVTPTHIFQCTVPSIALQSHRRIKSTHDLRNSAIGLSPSSFFATPGANSHI
jgi:hypothetical protein